MSPHPWSDSRPPIIGLCGNIGAGKDTVGGILEDWHGYSLLSFARALKTSVLDVFHPLGMEDRHVFGTQTDKAELLPEILSPTGDPRTGRECLELIGEAYRTVCPTTWAQRVVAEALKTIQRESMPVAITDVRYRNEVTMIREAGGVVWEVVKAGEPEPPRRAHASDNEWREVPKDAIIMARAGDLATLDAEVASAIAIGGRRHQELFA